tara:strand:- start:2745 stop:4274 length:1530 start_codon:yes stop_codon:yes gene_type:complete
MTTKFFKEDISNYREDTGCIPRSARAYYDINTSTIDLKKWKEENPDDYNEWKNTAVKCNSDFYGNENSEGCCYNENENTECLTKDNNTGLKFLGNEEIGVNGRIGNICHKEELQTLNNTLFDDTNKIIKFFKLILVSIVTLLVTALIGTCLEFWLHYGNSIECIYYKSKCANIGKTERISLVDYMFPNNICYYPYQACSRSKTDQSGGAKSQGIISNFAAYEHAGAKCITLAYDTIIYDEKPIPYNIADFAENNIKSEFILVLAKTISFYFLFPILSVRIFLNFFASKLSTKYQKVVKFNPLLSNFVFLLLTGLLFPFIGYLTNQRGLYFGPMIYVYALLFSVAFIMSFGFFIALMATHFPRTLFGSALDVCNIPESYYQIFKTRKLIYPMDEEDWMINIKNIVKNILLFFPFIILVTLSFVLGGFMTMVSAAYMELSLLFNIFYIPLSNPLECFSILKSHADLLTILFCIGVIGSAANSLQPTTTGIMSIILMLIIVYKAFKGMRTSF